MTSEVGFRHSRFPGGCKGERAGGGEGGNTTRREKRGSEEEGRGAGGGKGEATKEATSGERGRGTDSGQRWHYKMGGGIIRGRGARGNSRRTNAGNTDLQIRQGVTTSKEKKRCRRRARRGNGERLEKGNLRGPFFLFGLSFGRGARKKGRCQKQQHKPKYKKQELPIRNRQLWS